MELDRGTLSIKRNPSACLIEITFPTSFVSGGYPQNYSRHPNVNRKSMLRQSSSQILQLHGDWEQERPVDLLQPPARLAGAVAADRCRVALTLPGARVKTLPTSSTHAPAPCEQRALRRSGNSAGTHRNTLFEASKLAKATATHRDITIRQCNRLAATPPAQSSFSRKSPFGEARDSEIPPRRTSSVNRFVGASYLYRGNGPQPMFRQDSRTEGAGIVHSGAFAWSQFLSSTTPNSAEVA